MTFCEMGPSVVAWALHALEPNDDALIDEHLAHCEACRELLADAQTVTLALAGAVPQIDPPASLHNRLRIAVRAEPSEPPTTPARTITVASSPPVGGAPPARASAARPAGSRIRRRRAVLVGALAAAAVVGGVLGVSTAVSTTGSGPPDRDAVAQRAQRTIDDAATREPGTRHAVLAGVDGRPAAVVLDEPTGARVVPLAMSSAGVGHHYVLWAVVGGAPTAVAVVDPAANATVPLPGAVHPATPQAYAMSIEPTGPVPPTPTAVMAIGTLV